MHLLGNPAAPLLTTVKTNRNLTEQMQFWADQRVKDLYQLGLSGFIFKKFKQLLTFPSQGISRKRATCHNRQRTF
jgi:hypothetical protein